MKRQMILLTAVALFAVLLSACNPNDNGTSGDSNTKTVGTSYEQRKKDKSGGKGGAGVHDPGPAHQTGDL